MDVSFEYVVDYSFSTPLDYQH